MEPVTVQKALTSASANCICLSQTPAGAGNLTINGAAASGGVATLDTQRRVLLTVAADESGKTFTFYGTNDDGQPIQQAFAGPTSGTKATDLDFLTITRISVSAALAGAVTVGTNTTGSTPWKNPSWHLTPFEIDYTTDVLSGSVTYNLETTLDNYFKPATPTVVPIVRPTVINGATGSSDLQITSPIRGWRATVTAGTGTVRAKAIQAGLTN